MDACIYQVFVTVYMHDLISIRVCFLTDFVDTVLTDMVDRLVENVSHEKIVALITEGVNDVKTMRNLQVFFWVEMKSVMSVTYTYVYRKKLPLYVHTHNDAYIYGSV